MRVPRRSFLEAALVSCRPILVVVPTAGAWCGSVKRAYIPAGAGAPQDLTGKGAGKRRWATSRLLVSSSDVVEPSIGASTLRIDVCRQAGVMASLSPSPTASDFSSSYYGDLPQRYSYHNQQPIPRSYPDLLPPLTDENSTESNKQQQQQEKVRLRKACDSCSVRKVKVCLHTLSGSWHYANSPQPVR